MFGKTEGSMREIGKITKWMDQECLLGLMEENTLVIIKMIKKMASENLSGILT